jgi:hypothetical protein
MPAFLDEFRRQNYHSKQVIPSKLIAPIDGFLLTNHGEGGSSFVQHRPLPENELLDVPVEQFLASLRFEQRGKLDQLGIEI